MHTALGDHCVQVWSEHGYLPARKSDFRSRTKVPVSRDLDLDLDLEHTLDARPPADHPVQVW